jgi:putative NADH-flavin reductase
MDTIALFGATGKTGSVLLTKLISRNYQVKVLARNPTKLSISSPKLEIIQGDILDQDLVLKTIQGAETIINVIGHVKGCPPDLQTIATQHILFSMQKNNIQRLINLTGSGVEVDGDHPKWFDHMVVYIMKNLAGKSAKNRLIDGIEHTRIIMDSKVDWTIVRAPLLLSRPAKGKTRVGMVGHIPGFSLTFEDLSNEIIKILENYSFVRQLPYFTNG